MAILLSLRHAASSMRRRGSTFLRTPASLRLMNTKESYVKSQFPSIPPIHASDNIAKVVMGSWSSSTFNKLAIVDGMTGIGRTYGELQNHIESLAAYLESLGLQHGDCIGIISTNHVDYATVLLAALSRGLVVSPINPSLTSTEMEVQLKDANIKLVISSVDCPQAEDATSGTTGVPKGAILTHTNIIANLHQMMAPEGAFYRDDDVIISPLPMFHIYPLVIGMLFNLWRCTTFVFMAGRFSIRRFCELVDLHKATRAHLVPPIVLQLTKSPDVNVSQLASLRMVLCAAAPLYAPLEEECTHRIGCHIKQAWGMSELSPIGTMVPDDRLRSGSFGLAVADTEIKLLPIREDGVIDCEARGVPRGAEGELIIRGPQVMAGYLNAPKKTAECLLANGWLRTGDVARMDDDGFLYIVDRLKELIKFKGHQRSFMEQVAPAEIEDVITSHPKILDAAVIPLEDEEAGELPRAYVVCKSGETVLPEEVVQYVDERVSPFKKLRGGVVITDIIPKTGSGKILRRLMIQKDRAARAKAP